VTSTAFFVCPDFNHPSGGTRVIYRFVDTLNSAGVKSAVVHKSRNFRCSWFENSTKLVSGRDVTFEKGDLLVVPEWYRTRIPLLAPGLPHLIFNQNAYETFAGLTFHRGDVATVVSQDTLGIVAISQNNLEYLKLTFPSLPVHMITLAIDTELFRPTPNGKRRIIAFMPRKRLKELNQVLHILDRRGILGGWELQPIIGVSEKEVARILSEAGVFLAFNEREGIALPSLEAMASGCLTVGFHGGSGFEYMRPQISFPIPDGEIASFVLAIETVLKRWGDADLADMANRAVDFVRGTYTNIREREDVISVFGRALDVIASAEPPVRTMNWKLLDSESRRGNDVVRRIADGITRRA